MYARVVTVYIAPDALDHAIRLWEDSILPSVQNQKGFRNARLLVDRESGKVLSMGIWETESDLLDSVEWSQEQLEKFSSLIIAPPAVSFYELAAEG